MRHDEDGEPDCKEEVGAIVWSILSENFNKRRLRRSTLICNARTRKEDCARQHVSKVHRFEGILVLQLMNASGYLAILTSVIL